MVNRLAIIALFISQFAHASALSDGAMRLIQVGNEISSPDVVLRGQSLLLKGAFDLDDVDAVYELSKQIRTGNDLMGHPPLEREANQTLIKLVKQSYDPALYDYGLYLLDGEGGFIKNEFLALNLFEESFKVHANANSAFIAAVIRNESLVPGTKNPQRIDELLTFAILNKVKGAQKYQDEHVKSGYWRSTTPGSWSKWLADQ